MTKQMPARTINHRTANVIKQGTSRMNVALLALNWTTDDKRKEYYSTLDKEDLPGNIETLFNDLTAMHSMLLDEVMELEEYRLRLLEDNTTDTHRTANVIKQGTSRMNVALLALNWTTDDNQKEYYSTLCKEDLPHNIEMLFNDLSGIYSILIDEVMELDDYKKFTIA